PWSVLGCSGWRIGCSRRHETQMNPEPKREGDTVGDARAATFLAGCQQLVDQLLAEAAPASWGLTRKSFLAAIERSAAKRFAGTPVAPGQVQEYLSSLHLGDLALACACAEGLTDAWEHFVSTYQSYLRSAAGAILRCPANSPAARELADSLFAELYGLTAGKRAERSLFRYFHGRSSLKTWLRAILAQRHIDAVRAGRRFAELEADDSGVQRPSQPAADSSGTPSLHDPHRQRYLALFTRAMEVALGLLDPRDRERLRLYYAEGRTLAEIGRALSEHESS